MIKRLFPLFLAFATIPMMAGGKSKKKQTTAKPTTLEIINKVNDHWQATHKAEVKAFWDDAAYFTGNMEAYWLTGNARFLEYSDRWARHNRWSGATERPFKVALPQLWRDTAARAVRRLADMLPNLP